jgi:hypothetical protein
MQPYIGNDAARDARQRMIDHLSTLNAIRDAINEGRDTVAINLLVDALIQDVESRIIGVDDMMQRMGMTNR